MVKAAGHAGLGFEMWAAAFTLFGNNIDQPARGTTAMQASGAGKYFDPLDIERVNGIELARQAV